MVRSKWGILGFTGVLAGAGPLYLPLSSLLMLLPLSGAGAGAEGVALGGGICTAQFGGGGGMEQVAGGAGGQGWRTRPLRRLVAGG